MAIVALLFAPPEPLSGPLTVAGAAVIERQLRQARRAGASRTFVMHGAHGFGADVVNIDSAAMLGPRLADGDTVLVLAAGLVADDRMLDAVVAASAAAGAAPAVATWPAAARLGVERINALTFAAGIAVYPAALVRRTAMQLGDWDLAATLLRAALSEAGCVRVDLASLPCETGIGQPESHTGQRAARPIYRLINTPDAAQEATTAVLDATVRSRSDFLSRYLYAGVEQAALQLLAPTRITPHAITALTGGVGIGAAVAFGTGRPGAGLVLALLFGPFQHVGERLAQARAIGLRWHRWRVFSVLTGYCWWLALAGLLVLARGNGGPLAVVALLLLAQLTQASEAAVTRRRTGEPRATPSSLDRRIAPFAANRDSLAWLLVPFALAGQWYAGLIALAVYAVASFAVGHARFLQRLQS